MGFEKKPGAGWCLKNLICVCVSLQWQHNKKKQIVGLSTNKILIFFLKNKIYTYKCMCVYNIYRLSYEDEQLKSLSASYWLQVYRSLNTDRKV